MNEQMKETGGLCKTMMRTYHEPRIMINPSLYIEDLFFYPLLQIFLLILEREEGIERETNWLPPHKPQPGIELTT